MKIEKIKQLTENKNIWTQNEINNNTPVHKKDEACTLLGNITIHYKKEKGIEYFYFYSGEKLL